MKAIALFLVYSMLAASAACACTDPSPKKMTKVTDGSTIVYEYFHPAKLAEKKKKTRTIAEIADSLLTDAKAKFEAENLTADGSHIHAEVKGAPADYRERAEYDLYRIKAWADSICNSFRCGSYRIGPEDLPR